VPTYGQRPDDVVQDSRGNTLTGVTIALYATEGGATAGGTPLGTAVTDKRGRWGYAAGDGEVWARLPDGTVWQVAPPRGATKIEHDSEVAARQADTATRVAKGELVYNVKDYGAKVDGATADHAAYQAAINAAFTAGGGTVYSPPGTAIFGAKVMMKSGVRLLGAGPASVIKRAASYTGIDRLLGVENVTGVTVEHLTLDGNRYAFGANLTANIGIYSSDNVQLTSVRSVDAYGDGFYLEWVGGAHNANVRMLNCSANNNLRQGLSVCDVTTFRAVACIFTGSNGAAPQAGVDVEPSGAGANCADVEFTGCEMSSNAGPGFTVNLSTTPGGVQGDIRVSSSRMRGNASSGINLLTAYRVSLVDVLAEGNAHGLLCSDNVTDLTVIGGSYSRNLTHGIFWVAPLGGNMKVIGASVRNNSVTAANTSHGIRIQGTVAGVLVQGCSVGNDGATGQAYGITTAGSTQTGVRLLGNDFTGNQTGAALLSDDGTTRRVRSNRAFENIGTFVAQPAVAASGTNVTNTTGYDCTVHIWGGTYTDVLINNQTIGGPATTVRVPAGQQIKLTYTVAPTWKWVGE